MEIQAKKFNQAIDILIEKGKFKNRTECAKALKTTPTVLSNIRNGVRGVSQTLLTKIMKFGFTANWLFGSEIENEVRLNINYIPVNIHAGNSKINISELVKDNQAERFRFPSFMKLEGELFAFEVEGSSMTPTICNSDIVICREIDSVDDIIDGKIYVLLLKNKFVVKRLFKKIENFNKELYGIDLVSDNNDLFENSNKLKYPKELLESRDFKGLKGNLFKVIKRISINDLL